MQVIILLGAAVMVVGVHSDTTNTTDTLEELIEDVIDQEENIEGESEEVDDVSKTDCKSHILERYVKL